MGYLTNRTINLLNLHAGLFSLLEQGYWLFAPLYFYQRGFTLPQVFLLLALFNAARLPLRLLAFPIVHRIGLKRALMLGLTGLCVSFTILPLIQGFDRWLALYTLVFGLFNALHWHCYHTYYSMAGEAEHRGKQFAVAMGLGTAIAALGPFLSALFITASGFAHYFLLALPLLTVMLLVLSRCQDMKPQRTPWREGRKLMFNIGARMHLFDAASVYPLGLGWMFVMYLQVEKLVSLGGIVTFGIAVQVLYQLWMGGLVDRGRGHFIANAGGALRVAEVLLKALLPITMPRMLTLQAGGAISDTHKSMALSPAMYNTSQRSADPFWYWLFAESAYDLGTILGAGGAALLLTLGVPLRLTILAALPGVLGVWYLTHHYFARLRG